MEMEEWLGKLESSDPLVYKVATDYPAWLDITFGSQIRPTFGKRQRLYVRLRHHMAIYRLAIYCVFNPTGGVYIQLHEPTDEDSWLLNLKLSDPTSIKTTIKLKKKLGYAFRIDTDGDYDVLKTITRRLVAQ